MKFRLSVLAVAMLLMSCVGAQDYSYHRYKENPARYSKTVRALLDQAAADLDLEIVCDPRVEPYLEMTVPQAPWKLWNDPALRLAYILAPVDLTFEKTGEKSYRVFEPYYQQRPEAEGAAQLERLSRHFDTLEKWTPRRAALKSAILDRMGLADFPRDSDLTPILSEKRTYDGYTVQNVALQILPGVYLCGNLYLPTELKDKNPAVLCPHGHGEKGRTGDDQQYRAASLARMGAVVFAYGMFAWHVEDSPLGSTRDAHRDPISGAMQTWGSIRVLDYLCSLPYVDTEKIGITGCSGGGTQTFVAAALDDRIAASVPVVMVSSHFYGGCPCESGLPWHIDNGGTCNAEIAALAAPRPMLVVAVTQDWTKNVPEVEFPYLQKIYGLYGADAQANVEFAYLDQPHNYGPSKRQAMYPFLAKYLGLDISRLDESKVSLEAPADMFIFGASGENYPENGVKTLEELKNVLKK